MPVSIQGEDKPGTNKIIPPAGSPSCYLLGLGKEGNFSPGPEGTLPPTPGKSAPGTLTCQLSLCAGTSCPPGNGEATGLDPARDPRCPEQATRVPRALPRSSRAA